MLKNFQNALMKSYFVMGLKELAQVSGCPVAVIQACSQFKRTHHFLIEAWRAICLAMVQRYIEAKDEGDGLPLNLLHHYSLDQMILCHIDWVEGGDTGVNVSFQLPGFC